MPKITLIAHTPKPQELVAAAAKLCYSPVGVEELMNGLTTEKTAGFLEMLSTLGHQSPLEHAVFTFAIEGVSRTLMAQITRHRIASFSVQSQRYVSENNFDYVLPPAIEADAQAREAFEESMADASDAYEKIAGLLRERYIKEMATNGTDTPENRRAAEKQAIEDARFVLPGACGTKMMLTMNARSLRGFFAQRCCKRAQWEIRAVADEMLRLCMGTAPLLFTGAGPPCLRGACTEGKMSCGKMKEVRSRYNVEEG